MEEEEGEVISPEQHSASPGSHQTQQHALTEGLQQDGVRYHGHSQLAPPVDIRKAVSDGGSLTHYTPYTKTFHSLTTTNSKARDYKVGF